eukprot:4888636-Amphidinium_carterae.2
MSVLPLLPDDHWVLARQTAAARDPTLDAAERMLVQRWLLSTTELDYPSGKMSAEEYAEVLLVALFWVGLPSDPVT